MFFFSVAKLVLAKDTVFIPRETTLHGRDLSKNICINNPL